LPATAAGGGDPTRRTQSLVSWLRQAVQLASDFACAQLEVLPAPSAMDISASKPILKATVVIVPPDAS
jgi:hypothetical protein